MQKKSSRNWGVALFVAFAACLFVTVTGWLLAAPSPSQEIIHAVSASGKHDVKTAAPDTFIYAFTSVLMNTEKEQSGVYLAAAKSLRPDLSERIAATAAEVDSKPADGDGDGDAVSPHRRKCPVCHRTGRFDRDDKDGDPYKNQHTIFIPCKQVDKYLENHPKDLRGRCPMRDKGSG